MLGKMLRYELPAMGRLLIPLYIAWAAVSVLAGLALSTKEYPDGTMAMGIVSMSLVIIYAAIIAAVFVMFIVLVVQRFNRSMLGDEAYFSLTLPVSMSKQIWNKLLSSTIWYVASVFVCIISIALLFMMVCFRMEVSLADMIRETFNEVFTADIMLIFLRLMILMVVAIMAGILQIYASLVIGHQARRHTLLASLGVYIGTVVIEFVIETVLSRNISFIEMYPDLDSFNTAFIFGVIIEAVYGVIYFLVTKYFMEKRLNLQ